MYCRTYAWAAQRRFMFNVGTQEQGEGSLEVMEKAWNTVRRRVKTLGNLGKSWQDDPAQGALGGAWSLAT